MRCALIGSAALACSLTTLAWGQPRREPPSVGVEQVVEQDLTPRQTFVGEVVPTRTSIVGSAVDGRVVEVAIQEGQAVAVAAGGNGASRPEGEPLALLLTDTISLEIEAAQATLELRRQELAELVAGSRPEEIDQARARWESAKALKDYATSRFERVAVLFQQTTVSREDFEEALSTKLSAEQNEIAAQAACKLAVDGPREEQKKQAAARLAVAEKEVERLQDRLKKHTIRTPFAGFVTAKHAEVGQWVSAGDPIAEVVELDPIEINVPVPERYIAHVDVGAEVSVRIEALPGQAFTGKVERIIPQADVRARSFPVKVRLPNQRTRGGFALKAGMLAHVTLDVGPRQTAMLVHKDALVLEPNKPARVRVAENDPATNGTLVRDVPVQVGEAAGSLVRVVGELRSGQQVIVLGNERVLPGQPVRAVPRKPEPPPAPGKS